MCLLLKLCFSKRLKCCCLSTCWKEILTTPQACWIRMYSQESPRNLGPHPSLKRLDLNDVTSELDSSIDWKIKPLMVKEKWEFFFFCADQSLFATIWLWMKRKHFCMSPFSKLIFEVLTVNTQENSSVVDDLKRQMWNHRDGASG